MRQCPSCARPIEDYAQVCPFCRTNVAGPYAEPGHSETSGKAIGSLVCGLLFFFLPAAIVAVVMGHLSLSDIRKSAGRLGGRGMAIAGLVLGYLGLSFIPILIIAAIAIPNLLRAKMAANEVSAVSSLRKINIACVAYATEHKSFPSALANLGTGGHPSADASGSVGGDLATGQKSGYLFTYEPGPMQDAAIISYEVHADPVTPDVSGRWHYFTDQTGIIRSSLQAPANSESPPLQ
jgi:Domain of unknown function (DUF4190)